MHRPRILIVDDDPAIIKFVQANLRVEGYDILSALDGAEALDITERELPDLVILDIMLPKIDGVEVCRRLREWSKIPIIMLSARGDVQDKVNSLDAGADDYLSKPFSLEELLARIRAIFRRTEAAAAEPSPSAITFGELEINFAQKRVTLANQEVDLTATEYRLLSYLAANAGRVLTPDQILEKVWGEEFSGEHHLLRVNIARLRRKLQDNPKEPRFIATKTGMGYIFLKPH
ncbi:MAG TPA: response regulator transcription factor [Dehalococcoidia bacterium]|jgi:DNA-binding response OmpR family regulator|nr:response regulator transcription factor [Dehalococcoidia bacterium]